MQSVSNDVRVVRKDESSKKDAVTEGMHMHYFCQISLKLKQEFNASLKKSCKMVIKVKNQT